jgi:hypothetical protein
MTALQAALAGAAGAASGYGQQEELKRKRMQEQQDRERIAAMDAESKRRYEAEQKRQAQMDVASLVRSGAIEMQEEPAGMPPSVIPLPRADQVGGRVGVEVNGRRFAVRGAEEAAQLAERQRLGSLEEELKLRRKYATQPSAGGESDNTKLRTAYVNKYFTEMGEMPSDTQVNEYLRLVKGGKNISDIYGDSETPAARPAAPAMPQVGGGLFARDMFAAPAGAAPASDQDEIRALAARLAELRRGGRFGGIAAREEYERNAPERSRVEAALAEAQRRYRSR